MSRSARVIGVRLSGVVVRDARGDECLIPWEYTERVLPKRLRISPAAREAMPSLPEVIRGQYWLGLETVETLRVRAVARTLRDGDHERVWAVEPLMSVTRVFLGSLAAVAIIVAILNFYVSATVARVPVDSPEAAQIRNLVAGTLKTSVLVVIASSAVLGVVHSASRWFGKAIIGIRTTSAGITYVVEDGREVFQSWTERVTSKRDTSMPVRGLILTGSVAPSGDWIALKRAARGVYGPKRPWKLSRWRKWEHSLGVIGGPIALALVILIVSVLAPDRPVRPGGPPATLSELVQLAIAMWLWSFVLMSLASIFTAGLHRYIQIFNHGFARPKR